MPVPLIKIGRGKKLHIPIGERPLCGAHRNHTMAEEFNVDWVVGEGPTCVNCHRVIARISEYVNGPGTDNSSVAI